MTRELARAIVLRNRALHIAARRTAEGDLDRFGLAHLRGIGRATQVRYIARCLVAAEGTFHEAAIRRARAVSR